MPSKTQHPALWITSRWQGVGRISVKSSHMKRYPPRVIGVKYITSNYPLKIFGHFFWAVYNSILKRSARGPLCNISHFRNVGKSSTQKCLHEGRNFLKGNTNYSNDFVERNKSRDWGCSLNWLHGRLYSILTLFTSKKEQRTNPKMAKSLSSWLHLFFLLGFRFLPVEHWLKKWLNRKGCKKKRTWQNSTNRVSCCVLPGVKVVLIPGQLPVSPFLMWV